MHSQETDSFYDQLHSEQESETHSETGEVQRAEDYRLRIKHLDLSNESLEKAAFKEALAAHGIVDWGSMVTFSVRAHGSTLFYPFGAGCSFYSLVLGRKVRSINKGVLSEVHVALGLPFICETRKAKFKDVLREHGVKDRLSLMALGVNAFNKNQVEFGEYGYGRAFYLAIFGRPVKPYFRTEHLDEIADALGFPKISTDDYKLVFSHHGLYDRAGLIAVGPRKFRKKKFGGVGHGSALAAKVLDRKFSDDSRHLCMNDLHHVADKMRLPDYSVPTLKSLKAALFANGICDQKTMEAVKVNDFAKLDFGKFGKVRNYLGFALGRKVETPSRQDMRELAAMLRLPEDSEGQEPRIRHFPIIHPREQMWSFSRDQVIEKLLEDLDARNIFDRSDLLEKGPRWFEKKTFADLDIGLNIASFLLKRRVYKVTVEDLEEILDLLGYMDSPPEELVREIIRSHHAGVAELVE